jgi:hypothetical protein
MTINKKWQLTKTKDHNNKEKHKAKAIRRNTKTTKTKRNNKTTMTKRNRRP